MLGLASPAAYADAPRHGGTLIMALDTDPPTVNPDVTTGVPDVSVGSLVYDALTRIDESFQAVPTEPSLIIADEPLSGLDVSVRAQILDLLTDLQVQSNVSYLLITHDILLARAFSLKQRQRAQHLICLDHMAGIAACARLSEEIGRLTGQSDMRRDA
jgi:hypothetical protein